MYSELSLVFSSYIKYLQDTCRFSHNILQASPKACAQFVIKYLFVCVCIRCQSSPQHHKLWGGRDRPSCDHGSVSTIQNAGNTQYMLLN